MLAEAKGKFSQRPTICQGIPRASGAARWKAAGSSSTVTAVQSKSSIEKLPLADATSRTRLPDESS
jgi:hypothetical protein